MEFRAFRETRINVSGSERLGVPPLDVAVPSPNGQFSSHMNDIRKLKTQNAFNEDLKDVEDLYYSNHVATKGSTLIRKTPLQDARLPQSIIWRLLRNSHLLELDVIDLNNNSGARFRKIRFHISDRFLEDCIVVSEDGDNLVIDAISESGYLYTFSFDFSEFIYDSDISGNDTSLSENNARNWRSITQPYSFETHKPHMLYAVSSKLLVASITNGSLLAIDRELPLSQVSTYTFNDPSNGSGILRLLPWGVRDKVPGDHDMSIRTIISIVSFPEASLLLTLAINGSFKLWSLKSLSLIEEHPLIDLSKKQKENFFGPQPMKLISIPGRTNRNGLLGRTIVGTYLPTGNGLIKFWQLSLDPEQDKNWLTDLPGFNSLEPKIPDGYSTWFVNDFKLVDNISNNDSLSLSILWKSNTSSILYDTSIKANIDGEIIWSLSCELEESDQEYISVSNSQNDITKVYIEKIFGPNGYSCGVLETGLKIYAAHYAIDLSTEKLERSEFSLKDQVCHTVGTAATLSSDNNSNLDFAIYRKDVAQEWSRFDRLCSGLQNQGNEALAMEWDSSSGLYFIVRSSLVSVIRPAAPVELCYFNKSTLPNESISKIVIDALGVDDPILITKILCLLDTLRLFRRNLSRPHLGEIITSVMDDYSYRPKFDIEEHVTLLYQDFILELVSNSALDILYDNIVSIGDVDEVLEFIIKVISEAFGIQDLESMSPLTSIGCTALFNGLVDLLITSRLVIYDVLLALIASSPNENVISNTTKLYQKFLGLLKSVNSMLDVLNLSLTLPRDTAKGNESTMEIIPFMEYLTMSKNSANFQIPLTNRTFSFALNHMWKFIDLSSYNSSACEVIAELLAFDLCQEAQEISNYLPINSFTTFIKANIYLKNGEGSKARSLFKSAAGELTHRQLSEVEKDAVMKLGVKSFSESTFNKGGAKYFTDVSMIALERDLSITATNLAKDAKLCLPSDEENFNFSEDEMLSLRDLVLQNVFDTSLKSSSYDDAYKTLEEIYKLHDSRELSEKHPKQTVRDAAVTPLIEALVQAMVKSGNVSKLIHYSFSGFEDLVTNFIFKRATAAFRLTVLFYPNVGLSSDGIDPYSYYRLFFSWSTSRNNFKDGKFTFDVLL